jgi:hypothetical protein
MYEPLSNKEEGDEYKEDDFGFQERGSRNGHNDN